MTPRIDASFRLLLRLLLHKRWSKIQRGVRTRRRFIACGRESSRAARLRPPALGGCWACSTPSPGPGPKNSTKQRWRRRRRRWSRGLPPCAPPFSAPRTFSHQPPPPLPQRIPSWMNRTAQELRGEKKSMLKETSSSNKASQT
ncbi:unnamed protein product [Musa acuminata subsp. burmannicoides]